MEKCFNKHIRFKNICKLLGLFIITLFFLSCVKKDDFRLIYMRHFIYRPFRRIIKCFYSFIPLNFNISPS
jgi:hypothetical protein